MSALFNFQSLLLVFLLFVCTCTYARGVVPGLVDKQRAGPFSFIFKSARIGERLSPYVSLGLIAMAVSMMI